MIYFHYEDKKSPKFKEERNRKIYELYSDTSKRLSTSALARMFQISQTRVWVIIKDWEKRQKKAKSQNSTVASHRN